MFLHIFLHVTKVDDVSMIVAFLKSDNVLTYSRICIESFFLYFQYLNASDLGLHCLPMSRFFR